MENKGFDSWFEEKKKASTNKDGILGRLLEYGFLTGSRAFGTHQEVSDYDIVYCVYHTKEIDDILGDLERTKSEYFGGYYVETEGKKINLIPVRPDHYLPWYLATKGMKSTLKFSNLPENHIKEKYGVFQTMVQSWVMALPEDNEEFDDIFKRIQIEEGNI